MPGTNATPHSSKCRHCREHPQTGCTKRRLELRGQLTRVGLDPNQFEGKTQAEMLAAITGAAATVSVEAERELVASGARA